MDEKLLLLINREWTTPVLDKVMAAASSFDAWLPLLAIVIVAVFWRGGFRARAFLITMGLTVVVNDCLVANVLKHAIDRPRPYQSHNDVRVVTLARASPRFLALFAPAQVKMSRADLADVEGRSFPSSHTMNTLSVALVAFAFYGAPAAWAFAVAGIVAYSRVYTGSHWPSDVLTTVPLAVGLTLLWLALAHWLWSRHGGRLLPRVHGRHRVLFAV